MLNEHYEYISPNEFQLVYYHAFFNVVLGMYGR
jgi:hypothetical protein